MEKRPLNDIIKEFKEDGFHDLPDHLLSFEPKYCADEVSCEIFNYTQKPRVLLILVTELGKPLYTFKTEVDSNSKTQFEHKCDGKNTKISAMVKDDPVPTGDKIECVEVKIREDVNIQTPEGDWNLLPDNVMDYNGNASEEEMNCIIKNNSDYLQRVQISTSYASERTIQHTEVVFVPPKGEYCFGTNESGKSPDIKAYRDNAFSQTTEDVSKKELKTCISDHKKLRGDIITCSGILHDWNTVYASIETTLKRSSKYRWCMSSGKVEVRYVDTSDVVHVYTFIFYMVPGATEFKHITRTPYALSYSGRKWGNTNCIS